MKRINCVILVLGIHLCCLPFNVVCAQLPQPSEWAHFVNSHENTLQEDTFRLQTFGRSLKDNWEYVTEGNVKTRAFPKDETGLSEDRMGVQIGFPGSVEFTSFQSSIYKDVTIRLVYGYASIGDGDDLKASVFRDGKMITPTLNRGTASNKSDYFFQKIGGSPSYIKLYTEERKNTRGHYGLLEAEAFGSIPCYSYFTGSGSWNDTLRWSHLPAARHRSALIGGEITVNEDIWCDQIHLGSGTLFIDENVLLQTQRLEIHNAATSVSGAGELEIGKELTLHYEFPTKGEWYFMSFPCDVYADELSPDFSWKDASCAEGGNFIYVQVYDGSRRARQNVPSGNWKVLPAADGHSLLFERGKGYLVALDEAASRREIVFKVKEQDRNNVLLRSLSRQVSFPVEPDPSNKANYGWQLMGNPFAAPLHFSQLRTSGFDHQVYLYESGGYRCYDLSDAGEVPPYASFFMKANQASASVSFEKVEEPIRTSVKQSVPSAFAGGMEPCQYSFPTASLPISVAPLVKVAGNRCIITCQASRGLCRFYTLEGRLLQQYPLQMGRNELVWDAPSGYYLLDIEMNGERAVSEKVFLSAQ